MADETYWNPTTRIETTNQEKLVELEYEIEMFFETNKRLRDQYLQNLLIESYATHARVLIDFFYPKKPIEVTRTILLQMTLYKIGITSNRR